jgi:CMP-N-acetylneuraminic acid synthetase
MQNFPQTYLHNGYIDIVKTSVILEQNLLSGTRILPYVMKEEEDDDIDEIEDFIKSETSTF